jgi:hypothetical protein
MFSSLFHAGVCGGTVTDTLITTTLDAVNGSLNVTATLSPVGNPDAH